MPTVSTCEEWAALLPSAPAPYTSDRRFSALSLSLPFCSQSENYSGSFSRFLFRFLSTFTFIHKFPSTHTRTLTSLVCVSVCVPADIVRLSLSLSNDDGGKTRQREQWQRQWRSVHRPVQFTVPRVVSDEWSQFGVENSKTVLLLFVFRFLCWLCWLCSLSASANNFCATAAASAVIIISSIKYLLSSCSTSLSLYANSSEGIDVCCWTKNSHHLLLLLLFFFSITTTTTRDSSTFAVIAENGFVIFGSFLSSVFHLFLLFKTKHPLLFIVTSFRRCKTN